VGSRQGGKEVSLQTRAWAKSYKSKMISNLEIRESLSGDTAGIEKLYAEAFPDEDLLPLVRELLGLGLGVVSLVGVRENTIIGHINFTFCNVEGEERKVALLAPLAVTPALQKQGIGSRLIQTGFEKLKKAGIAHIFVLGDPAYYGRFGFRTEDRIATPYPLPTEWRGAWQSVKLIDEDAPIEGRLSVPEPWRHVALWTS
jgi:putative acetyltransferase